MILVSGKLLDLVDHAGEHVCIIVALLSLKYHAETLESHTSINVVVREQFKFAVRLSVILHEHKVPDFDHERVALVHEVASRNGCSQKHHSRRQLRRYERAGFSSSHR